MPALPTPGRGEVIFHRACFPALFADDYELRVNHQLGVDTSSKPLPGERKFAFAVDGPRFTLESSLIHGVFPPTNGRGAYVSRLPQIVLRRRTIPWERALPGTVDTPWMALLLFEDGEATTVSPCTVGDVISGTGIAQHKPLALGTLSAATRAQPCIAVDVALSLFEEIAPMASELPLLSHVRQVNTEDKELLGMDDDGWFAVVVGNRIPEPGKKYLACLVSLEGAQGYLPSTAAAAQFTAADLRVNPNIDFAAHAEELMKFAVLADDGVKKNDVVKALANDMAASNSKYSPFADRGNSSVSGTTINSRSSKWTDIKTGAGTKTPVKFIPPTLRLFCLAQWSFECLEGGDFESIMQALPNNGGVAMLGMPPALAQAPDSTGASGWKAALDTGHVPLEHLTREGERTIAWYRGPLTPVGVTRRSEGPFHTSDQARRIDPETGLENLGYAAGFEIGRLLALGDPRFALDLLRWRRSDRLRPDVRITFDIVNRFAAVLARDLRFDPGILFTLPASLATMGGTVIGTVMTRKGLGKPMDPTGLVDVIDRLPGLKPEAVAQSRGLSVEVVNGILRGATVGSTTVLDTIGIGSLPALESNLDIILKQPTAHYGALTDAFDARMRDLTAPRR